MKRSVLVLSVVSLVVTLVPMAPLGAFDNPTSPVFINELHYDNVGTDEGEAVEVAGPAGTVLDGWSILLYNGSNGALYGTRTLSGSIPDQGAGYGAVHEEWPSNGIQNGAPDGLALVDGGGTVVQFLSYEGTFTAVGGPADGMTSTEIPAQTGAGPVGESLQLTGAGSLYGDFDWLLAEASFGCLNAGQTDIAGEECGGDPGIDPEPDEPTLISAVQGSTDTSPLAGRTVTIEGIVVGDYEGPSPALRGFYVQEEESDWDDDPATSEGVFVFHGNEDRVSVGDLVSVTGTVAEFQGQTQLGFPSQLEVLASGHEVAATEAALPVPDPAYLERYEGMRVAFPQELFVTEHFQLGRFGQVVVSGGDRLQQPTAVAEPGTEANAVQAANDRNRLIVDDTDNAQNADPIVFGRNGEPLTAENTLRGGDSLTGATGVLTYTWAGNQASPNAYRLRPADPDQVFHFAAGNRRPTAPPEVGGSLQVASFNVLNYFLTLDRAGNQCGVVPDDCRGAQSELELQRQRGKLLAALARLDADILGLMELENTPGVSPETDLVDGLNQTLGDGSYAAVDAGTVGEDVIRVGLLYKPGAVSPLGDPVIIDYGDGRNRASLAQTFVESATGEVFSVVVNHFKSKGCDEATGADADQGDGQGCWNATRVAAAAQLVESLENAGHGDDDWLVIGDLNSYDHEDPIDVLAEAGFVDLARRFGGDQAYSYVFDGQWGYLDYALASGSLLGQVTGTAEYHINADEPSVLDYNTNFKTAAQIDYLYAPDEYRTSDHDPVVVGLAPDGGLDPLSASPERLWPPNHRYRTVELEAGAAVVSVVGVASSEPDSGLGPEDVPNDAVIVDGDTVLLRAERYSTQDRIYTIEARVSGGTQVRFDATTVVVAHNMASR